MRSACLAFLFCLFVICTTPPFAQALAAKAGDASGGAERKWAFCVGVAKYADPLIPALPTGSRDAREIGRVLEEHGGFDEVFVLADDVREGDPGYPSRRNILAVLNRARDQIRPNDLVLFSFSGSGCMDESGKNYLLAPESRTGSLQETAVSVDAVLDWIQRSGARRSVFVLDAARQGVQYKGRVASWGVYPDRYLKKGVSAVFYAAAKGYTSTLDENSEHTAFAGHLLRGLEGAADGKYGGNRDGIVTLRELASFVSLSLAEWCLATSRRQVPWVEILDRGQSDMALSTVEKTRVAKAGPPPAAPPAEPPRKDSSRKEGPAIAATPEKKPRAAAAPVVRPPAPRIDDLMKEGKTPSGEAASRNASARKETPRPEGPAKEPSREELKVVLVERVPAQDARPVEAEQPLSSAEKPQKADESKVGSAPPATQEPAEPSEGRKAGEAVPPASREEKKTAVLLRARPKNVPVEEMKAILAGYGFYSTCWNYNGDFCNPAGNFENFFKDNGNGTISDGATGLMWQKGGSGEGLPWTAAREYADKANRERLGGHSDWRVPTVEELGSIMESSWKNGDLFIDPVFDRTQRQCWSSDTRGTDSAWKANFHQGFFMDFPIQSRNYVRLVRTQKGK